MQPDHNHLPTAVHHGAEPLGISSSHDSSKTLPASKIPSHDSLPETSRTSLATHHSSLMSLPSPPKTDPTASNIAAVPVTGTHSLGKSRFVVLIGLALQTFLTAGLVMGWAGMVVILKRDQTYAYLCDEREGGSGVGGGGNDDEDTSGGVVHCDAIDVRLNLIAAVSVSCFSLLPLPLGPVTSYCGPKIVALYQFVGLIGCLMCAFAEPGPGKVDTFFIGMVVLNLVGNTALLASLHVANLFPSNRNLVLFLMSSLYGGSSVIFPFLEVLNHYTGLTRRFLFLIMCVYWSVSVFFSCLLPKKAFERGEVCAFNITRNWGFYVRRCVDRCVRCGEVKSHCCHFQGEREVKVSDIQASVVSEIRDLDAERREIEGEPLHGLSPQAPQPFQSPRSPILISTPRMTLTRRCDHADHPSHSFKPPKVYKKRQGKRKVSEMRGKGSKVRVSMEGDTEPVKFSEQGDVGGSLSLEAPNVERGINGVSEEMDDASVIVGGEVAEECELVAVCELIEPIDLIDPSPHLHQALHHPHWRPHHQYYEEQIGKRQRIQTGDEGLAESQVSEPCEKVANSRKMCPANCFISFVKRGCKVGEVGEIMGMLCSVNYSVVACYALFWTFTITYYFTTANLQIERLVEIEMGASGWSTGQTTSEVGVSEMTLTTLERESLSEVVALRGSHEVSKVVDRWIRVFSWITPLGVVGAVLGGLMGDRFGVGFVFCLNYVLGCTFLVCTLLPSLHVQVLSFGLYAVAQEINYATFYSYLGETFPAWCNATLGGTFICCQGILFVAINPIVNSLISKKLPIILPHYVLLCLASVLCCWVPLSFYVDYRKCKVRRWEMEEDIAKVEEGSSE
eukprot:GHVN01057324.1.p1 GENE.GHVN01057324.1~~GHVN01057324.1.p1  ORF type:complete len:847 (+),score=144.42 GHVN01057324.1:238-2778(+)